jgi:hypothetical protein
MKGWQRKSNVNENGVMAKKNSWHQRSIRRMAKAWLES